MKYREFRDLYRGMGADEIWRQKVEGYDFALVAKKQPPVVIPFTFNFPTREIILPDGDETVLEDEEVEIHLRAIIKLLGKSKAAQC